MVANESKAAFLDFAAAVKDRELFVTNLGWLLSQTREGITDCKMVDAETSDEAVIVTWKGGHTEKIHTAMDSYLAIIRDVTKRL